MSEGIPLDPKVTFLTQTDLAERWKVSRSTVRRMRQSGTGPKVTKVSDGRIRYNPEHVRAWEEGVAA